MHNSAEDSGHSGRQVILKFDPDLPRRPRARQDEKTLGQYIPLVYHYNMLQDEERVGAFQAAIASTVRPGMRVVELGSGTGILSSFAARQGATVDSVERNPELVDCSRRFLSANGLQDRVRVVAADAAQWIPEQPVDVVICEMLHVGLLREKQAQVISAFKHHYALRFGAQLPLFIPEVSILMCQPVQYNFDFAGYVAPVPSFHAPTQTEPRTKEIAPLATYQTVDYGQAIPAQLNACESFSATASGVVNAIRLVTQNVLTVDVESQVAVTWPNQCLILPVDRPFVCSEGEVVDVTMDYEAGGAIESICYEARSRRSIPPRNAA